MGLYFSKGLHMKKKYGILNFLLDLVLTGLTGGLWLIWIVFRFLRRNS
jgi:hypothetical protein